MKKLTEDHLRQFVADFERAAGTRASNLVRLYLVAAEALVNYLSPEWAAKHVFSTADPNTFLRPNPVLLPDRFKHQDRVISLAEMIFNFQAVEGVEERVKIILSAGDVESTVAELEGAKLLYRGGLVFRFVSPSGPRGSNYDVEIDLPGMEVPCEMKCKLEATDLGSKTIKDTLNTARSQLPTDGPGVVFVKIPESWVQSTEIVEGVSSALQEVFRNTGRISLVVFHWEEWYFPEGGGAVRVVRFRPEHNERARLPLTDLANLVKNYHELSGRERWRYFRDIVCI